MKIPERHKPLVVVLLLAVIAFGIGRVITHFRNKSERVIVRRIVSSVAAGSARETARFLDNQGRIVIIETEPDPGSRIESLQKEFRDEVEGYGKIKVIATERVPNDQVVGGFYGMAVAPAHAAKLLEKYKDADAIVSLVGLFLIDPDNPPAPDRKPRIIAVTWALTGVKAQFEQKAIDLAIVPRYQRPPPPGSGDPKRWFDRDRQVVTAETAASLPDD